MAILKYKIPKMYKVSTNAIYSGNMHWSKRKTIAWYFHRISHSDCKELRQYSKKVNIKFEFYFKSTYLDSSNCTFMGKMIEDWFVRNWLIEDDTNKFIGAVTYESILIEKKERKEMEWDYVKIYIDN